MNRNFFIEKQGGVGRGREAPSCSSCGYLITYCILIDFIVHKNNLIAINT